MLLSSMSFKTNLLYELDSSGITRKELAAKTGISYNTKNIQATQFDTFFEGMFRKDRLLDILKNFICFDEDEKQVSDRQ